MPRDPVERRLVALLSADAVGYSRLMAEDDVATLRALAEARERIGALVREHRGRVVDAPGDNLLAEFPSALDAAGCAVDVQRALAEAGADVPAERRLRFRIGVHLGDLIAEEGRVYGDGVNIAARLEGLADPGGICVSATVYEQVRYRLDVGFEDLGARPVKGLPDPVRAYRVRLDRSRPAHAPRRRGRRRLAASLGALALLAIAAALLWPRAAGLLLARSGAGGPPEAPPLPGKPSIAVLPFANLSGDPEQEYFSDGITEDLITDLSRIPELFVIASNSAFAYKGQAVDVERVGRELGVRYVLEGSVRRAGDRVRITAQLVDATTAHHLWAERYDRPLVDIFALQSELTREILTAMRVGIRDAEVDRMLRRGTDDLAAYDTWLRGYAHFQRSTREDNLQARHLFERAAELDPGFAEAWAMLGTTYILEFAFGWSQDPALVERAEALAERAVAVNPASPTAHTLIANVHIARREFEEGIAAAERAIELAPSIDVPHLLLALALAQSERPGAALAPLERALRLNPRGPSAAWTLSGFVQYAAGHREQALELWERSRSANPEAILARLPLVAIYAHAGRLDEARGLAREILAVNPQLTAQQALELLPLERLGLGGRPELVAAMHRAGLPDARP